MLGQKINVSKNKLYGIGVGEEEVKQWARCVGCSSGVLPLTYLGLPVGAQMCKVVNWRPAIAKLESRLTLWKTKLISSGGRLTMVKSVLGQSPLVSSFEWRFKSFRESEKRVLLGEGSVWGE